VGEFEADIACRFDEQCHFLIAGDLPMPVTDFTELPRFDDRVSYLYLDRCNIERHENTVASFSLDQCLPIPIADLALLMLGPGSTISHAAISVLAESNCLLAFVGEQGVRLYSHGKGGTHVSSNMTRQATLWANTRTRRLVVRKMYSMRFDDPLEPDLTIEQIRGREGHRVRRAYERASIAYNVAWQSRNYDATNWNAGDPLNRALSTGSACLNGLAHAAILTAGYSPGLGFIHSGKALSFVYDVADLFKVDLIVPIAFGIVAESSKDVERRTRGACRDTFGQTGLMKKLIPAIKEALDVGDDSGESAERIEGGTKPMDDRAEGRDLPWSHDRPGA
jgi:CRISPR-associated protein Cas1